ncbi:RNA-binding protein 5-like isoform X2 [Symsagittifera roscoffensis]|uniref:RNA-binding protein 5-like isoform X2 n=1 Tax=Symsagittifera roscoffensis TaxID=84072 RepID=UPI00307B9EEB
MAAERSRSRSRNRGSDRSSVRSESSRKSSSRISRPHKSRERERETSDASLLIPSYLKQTPTKTVFLKDLSKYCTEEDIRQEVEAFGAPIKDITIEQKNSSRGSRESSSSRSRGAPTSSGAYLQFLRLEDAQRWMEQSQGKLRVCGEWVEMSYSDPKSSPATVGAARRSSRERGDSSRRRDKRSRSSSRSRRKKSPRSTRRSRSKSKSFSRSRRNRSRDRSARRDRDDYEDRDSDRERSRRTLAKEWDCFNCNGRNYPRRSECYRCAMSREESERSLSDLSLQQISTRPTKYLIIRELDALTSDETLQITLSRLSPVFIKQSYISRDPLLQVSNCYAYVELNNEADAEKLKNHLQAKNFTVDNKKVTLFFSKSCGDETVRGVKNTNPPSLYNEPKVTTVIQKPKEEDLTHNPLAQPASVPTQPHSHLYPSQVSASSVAAAAAAPQVTRTVNVNGQLYPVFPVPNTALYVYDANSGYYYDHQTMLYYDANTKYYYNSTTQKFLYWDGHYSTYLPLPTDTQQQQQQSVSANGNQDQSPTNQNSSGDQSSQKVTLDDNRGSVSFTIGGGAKGGESNKKNDKNKTAKQVREDMERWTKSVNSLRRAESNRAFPVQNTSSEQPNLASGANSNAESSSSWGSSGSQHTGTADVAFAALERRNMLEIGLDKNLNGNSVDNNSEFKRVLLDAKPATALNPIGTFGHNDDTSAISQPQNPSASQYYTNPNPPAPPQTSMSRPGAVKATLASEEVRLTDWVKLACLLCKRQFKDSETLIKHQKMSDLHKSNMEQHMKKMESSEDDSTFLQSSSSSANNPNNEDEYDSLSSMFQYRDRAKERREKHGISAPPLREYEKAYSSASSSSAKSKPEEPLGTTNVGNKLLKGMGWKEGEGLGKSKQGITAPIKASGRDSMAGLGAVSYTRDPNKSYAENARHALLSRVKGDT